jgi:hypothetical protein
MEKTNSRRAPERQVGGKERMRVRAEQMADEEG